MVALLVIAPTVDGEDVGEAWVAFQWAHHLAQSHDVTLLTYHKRGATPASRQLHNVRVVEWAEPRGLDRAERFNSLLKPGYLPFYLRARRWIRAALARDERFDLVHQPVPVAMRYPSPAAGLGLPLVIGPVGGGLTTPSGFSREADTAPWYTHLRAVDRFRLHHDPLLRHTYETADCVVGIAPYVAEHLNGLRIKRFATMSETALPDLPPATDRSGHGPTIRLLHVGRLVRTKGAREAVRALDLLRDLPVFLDVVGDGPDRAACERLAGELGVTERVRFHRRLPRGAIDRLYRDADVFVFPSFREPGGNVTFEAMGHGLPVVVCDRGGPGAVVDDTCGIRVPAVSPEQLTAGIAAAVRVLVVDPQRRTELGAGAREAVMRRHLWPRRIEQMSEQFRDVLSSRGPF